MFKDMRSETAASTVNQPHSNEVQLNAKASRKLASWGIAAAVAGGGLLAYASPYTDLMQTGAGLIIYGLAVWPLLEWARKARPWFPVFELFMATGLAFYAIPYLSGREEIAAFSTETLFSTAWVLIAFQLSAYMVFKSTRGKQSSSRTLTEEVVPTSITRNIGWGLWINTAYIYLSNFTDLVPYNLQSIFRAIFFGLGIVSVFIACRQWGEKKLSTNGKLVVVFNLLLQTFLQAASLYLISVIAIHALSWIAYATSSRRIPLVIFLVLPVLAILHEGKSKMRSIYWAETRTTPAFAELPSFYAEWVEYGLNPSTDEDEDALNSGLLHRASLFQMLALTVDQVPSKRDFLGGDSYWDIPALFVPRIIWADKPTALESNDRLSIYFGLVREGSSGNVSIAFGTIAEAYANFGLLGAVLLGTAVGYGFKRVTVAAIGAPSFSALGLFSILLTAWSFQVEMVAATWISSLYQATLVVVVGPLLFKRFFP